MNLKSRVGSAALAVTLMSSGAVYSNPDIAGKYQRARPSKSDMTVARAGDQWKISLKGAGDPMPADAAAGDCEMQAAGTLKGGVLIANVVPFQGDDISVSADDLKHGKHLFVVKFNGRSARVTSQDVSFCGSGADLLGVYSKGR